MVVAIAMNVMSDFFDFFRYNGENVNKHLELSLYIYFILRVIVRGPEGATVHPPPYDPTFWVSFCSLGSIISEKRCS